MAISLIVPCIFVFFSFAYTTQNHSLWDEKVDVVSVKSNHTQLRTIFLPKGSIQMFKPADKNNGTNVQDSRNKTFIIKTINSISVNRGVMLNDMSLSPNKITKNKSYSTESYNKKKVVNKNNELPSNKTWGSTPKTQLKLKANKVAKVLSIFTVVNFTNEQCSSDDGLVGTCYASDECLALSGQPLGPCAQGFGVCCYVERSCGTISAVNNTYMSGADIELDAHTGVFMCTVFIQKISPEVRQLRLTFKTFELAGPINGNCAVDSFVIKGQNTNNVIPALCGSNSGKHVYVDVDASQGPIAMTILSSGARGLPRNLRVRVTQLTMDHPLLAPHHCLQFYAEPRGVIESFNYSPTNASAAYGYTNNLNYAICFKKLPGYCSIAYSNTASMGRASPFEFVNIDLDGIDTVAAGQAGVEVFNCPDDYITVSGLRLCGYKLNDGSVQLDYLKNHPVTDTSSGPLIIGVRTNRNKTGRGFRLEYRLQACLGFTPAPDHTLLPQPNSSPPLRFPLATPPSSIP